MVKKKNEKLVPKKTTKKVAASVPKKEVLKKAKLKYKYKEIANSLNVIVGKETKVKKGTKEERQFIISKLDKFNKLINKESLPALKLEKEILEAINTTKVKQETKKLVEKAVIRTQKKVIKKQVRETTKQEKTKDQLIKKLLSPDLFEVKEGEVYKKGFDVKMPTLLVDRILDFLRRKLDIKPLMNFWDLCLLNPNPIARVKLFDYLSLHSLMVTKSGFFVTYRMVKTTNNIGVYTHASYYTNSPKMLYKIGEVAKLDRKTQCDEDGSRDCSKGLHTGSPLFIGITKGAKKIDLTAEVTVGKGYGITTKTTTPDSYGTGYDRPESKTEKFDQTFGNQAVICLVNPMHVVSVPNSDTRKLRACELYFAATTTAEEVISHLEGDIDIYDGHDNKYKALEKKQIEEMLKTANMKDLFASRKKSKAKLEELDIAMKNLKLSDDIINIDINFEQFKNIINERNIKL